ncbi:MATH domain and coiled-coil domain-containing protein At3g58360-like [Macadamia integrifolia]|uniref:MATH domain and coiled-coil domain-containing protein At3g58360-like n=1 Tax=Macadamia integrifolia TaxID=60698 RepID=UPI001C4E9073|nr:MATH domain and coiled-coil domain-containing protein At3g58360-like [Macadamia integrifolia]
MYKIPRPIQKITVSESWREDPPAHFSWKISSFLRFFDLDMEEHYSGFFMVGGYKWRLCLHPKGNENESGESYISLYLEMMKPTSSTDWEVHAKFKLFVFDQKNGYYRTLEETQQRLFHAMKNKWGFGQFMSLATLKEPSNGFLIKGTCVFGAEVVVQNERIATLTESLQLLPRQEYGESTLVIRISSDVSGSSWSGSPFFVGGYQWRMMVQGQPKGVKGGYLSVFLELYEASSLPSDRKVYANYILRVVDQKASGNDICHRASEQFSAESGKWGNDALMHVSNIKDPTKGFLVSDLCKLRAEVTVLGLVI